jgi:hypothetical protein
MAKKKSWSDKLNDQKEHQIKPLEKDFWSYHKGDVMLIATPQMVDAYVKNIPPGSITSQEVMRYDLAAEYHATFTCPLTTGIFLRIVAEAAYEAFLKSGDSKEITPFWRIIEPGSKLAAKLSCGEKFIEEMRLNERETVN